MTLVSKTDVPADSEILASATHVEEHWIAKGCSQEDAIMPADPMAEE
jgi:hypothetical protein